MNKWITRIGGLFLILLLTTLIAVPWYYGWIGPDQKVSTVDAFPRLDFDLPMGLYQIPDNNTFNFVVEQGGKIKVFENERLASESSTFLDVSDRVFISSENGLVGMAFHPEFEQNGKVYTFWMEHHEFRYNIPKGNCEMCSSSIVSEFTLLENSFSLNMSSQRVLLELNNTQLWHHGGQLNFDEEGYLLIHLGDDSKRWPSQDLNSYLGKILRVDVDEYNSTKPYSIPSDNPFVGIPNVKEEIWAYGLRNPWRGDFDPLTGTYWVGDVGEDSYEEIDVIKKGGNYGWPYLEGDTCFIQDPCDPGNFTSPILAYTHPAISNIPVSTSSDEPNGVAVIGGQVYRGSEIEGLQGKFIFADYSGSIWSLDFDDDLTAGETTFLHKVRDGASQITRGNDGELYINGIYRGIIFKIINVNLFTFILIMIIYLFLIFLIARSIYRTFKPINEEKITNPIANHETGNTESH